MNETEPLHPAQILGGRRRRSPLRRSRGRCAGRPGSGSADGRGGCRGSPRHLPGQRQGPPLGALDDRREQRRQPRPRPSRLQGVRRLCEGQARRGRIHHHAPAVHLQRRHRLQPDSRLARRRPEQGPDGRGPPRLGLLRRRDQRQRLRLGRRAGDRARRLPRRTPARQASAVRLVGRGGAGPGRLPVLRQQPAVRRAFQALRLSQLRHDRLAQRRLLRLRRRPGHREDLQGLLRGSERPHRDRGRGRRPLRPRPVQERRQSPSGGSSPARATPSPPPRRRSGAERRARPSTAATTPPATT
ncbi:hypothetical protein GA0115255_122323 [Streptomyces sp. Ncost-T6T-2b]|nr:hypothetical protein GA0115255_122323 [Streptomyces sp. Ncost-T6T-2b]